MFSVRPASYFPGFKEPNRLGVGQNETTASPPTAYTPLTGFSFPHEAFERINVHANLSPADVAVVLAHPDDELFLSGTVATLRRKGYRVQFVYATSGEAGQNTLSQVGWFKRRPDLGALREKEVTRALAMLNVDAPPVMLRYPDGKLAENREGLQMELTQIFRALKPRLVLTFGPDGLTGHSDHKLVGQVTDDVARSIPQTKKGGGVYHMALTPQAVQQFHEAFNHELPAGWQSLQALPSKNIQVKVPVRSVNMNRWAVLRQHQSQFDYPERSKLWQFFRNYPFETFAKEGKP